MATPQVAAPLQQQPGLPIGALSQQQPAAEPKQAEGTFAEEDPKAALKKGVEETEEQILFSCNICYDVSR